MMESVRRSAAEDSDSARSATSRREFLRAAVGAAAGWGAGLGATSALCGKDALTQRGSAGALRRTMTARVVHVSSAKMMPVRVVQRTILRDALSEGMKLLTGEQRAEDAWRRFLAPDDVILVKFNGSCADKLGTSEAMAVQIAESLTGAGFSPRQVMLLEAPPDESAALRSFRKSDLRWQGRVVRFGVSGADQFIAALNEATAIINVPFLKTHQLATMSGCLKNLSHGLIRRPARFHADGCNPAIGEIVATSEIRNKLRLNVVNAVRVVFDGGPDATDDAMHTSGTLLLGQDPVACDAVGYGLLNEIRAERRLGPILAEAAIPSQLQTAHRLGIGEADIERIDCPLISV